MDAKNQKAMILVPQGFILLFFKKYAKAHKNQAYPRKLCDASNMSDSLLLAPKSTKRATKKNELSTHPKINISSMIFKIIFLIRKNNFKKCTVFFS